MKIYVATSWRNTDQPHVVRTLRYDGYEVYDFRNPVPGDHGFSWSEIDKEWMKWTPEMYLRALNHPLAKDGFSKDMEALNNCDAVVLLTPCGRSAHLKAGYAIGQKKFVVVLLRDVEPELMYKMFTARVTSLTELQETLDHFRKGM